MYELKGNKRAERLLKLKREKEPICVCCVERAEFERESECSLLTVRD